MNLNETKSFSTTKKKMNIPVVHIAIREKAKQGIRRSLDKAAQQFVASRNNATTATASSSSSSSSPTPQQLDKLTTEIWTALNNTFATTSQEQYMEAYVNACVNIKKLNGSGEKLIQTYLMGSSSSSSSSSNLI